MPGRLEFDLSLSAPHAAGIPNRGAAGGAVRLLLLGDFSGRPPSQRPPLATRPTLRVDADNLDARLAGLGTGLDLGGTWLSLESLDDFHPDSLLPRLPADSSLSPAPPAAAPAADDAGEAALLARLLGGGAAVVAGPPVAAAPGLEAFIRQLVAPHVVRDDPAARAAAEAADSAAARRLRALLHAPAFQALEANWRGLHWLVSQLELDEQLQLHLFDVRRDELLDDLVAAGGQVQRSGLYQALVQRQRDQPGGGAGWQALVGLWAFGPSVQHIGLLAALGQTAAQARAPLLAGADLVLAADDPQALAGWHALRHSEVAPWIGLAAPGPLLRQPYGPRSDPVQSLDFEEFGGGAPDVARCLWGPAALVPALLLARGQAGAAADVDGLPAVSWRQGGESHLLPVAWPALDEAGAQRLQQAGLMPLWAHRQQPVLRLACWQSVAQAAP